MFIWKSHAIKWAGSQAELARRLGITRQAVNLWKPRHPIPQRQAIKLTKLAPEEFK
jgi:DNA-binding transcriptional regulator YiaG